MSIQSINKMNRPKTHLCPRYSVKLKLHLFDLFWISCSPTTSCTRNPQQIEMLYSKSPRNSQHLDMSVEFSARLAVDLLYHSSQSRKRVYMTLYCVIF